MKLCQHLRTRFNAGLFAAAVAVATGLIAAPHCRAAASEFKDLRVEVQGQGRPVLMIPGLNSAASAWTETCAALQPQVQCHIVQLPGFAGQPAIQTPTFLAEMRDRLWAYIDARQLKQPVLMGHSLGGALALMMAAERPAAVERLVIVDSLPFIGGLRGGNVTPEQAQQMAEGMRQQMLSIPPELWKAGAEQATRGMTRDPERSRQVLAWGQASDRLTTIQAMTELWGADLRPLLPKISSPVLVLGAWAAYEPMGSTMESTRHIFEQQYAGLPHFSLAMSERGYHFLMWDDAAWLQAQVRGFLATPAIAAASIPAASTPAAR